MSDIYFNAKSDYSEGKTCDHEVFHFTILQEVFHFTILQPFELEQKNNVW